ncbi:helix-turn-helix transcriptional regulator [Lawsonibacter sp. JLR.KK007]|uniref:helix-turn-helix transcriptional regulator n=1 Tax=Lawsonibacter sp. JLR.KK007 TaxID=3114293 RepID=UPI002FEE6B92
MRIDRVKFAAALARADLNVKQLAECSGVSRVTVTAVKNGKSCSQATADKLARVLGRDIIQDATAMADNAN